MGVLYSVNSVALIEDLPLQDHYNTTDEFYVDVDKAYKQVFAIEQPLSTQFDISIFFIIYILSYLERTQLLDCSLHLHYFTCNFWSSILRKQPFSIELKKILIVVCT